MSTLEKKALAFEKLAALQNDHDIEEIIVHLDKLNRESKVNASVLQHAISIINERSSVLEKLAQ
jgi:hypothetical protein